MTRIELETEIGAPLDSSRALVEPGPPAPLPDAVASIARALRSRPELAAADDALQENAWRLEAARAGRKPQVNLTGTAQYLGPNLDEDYWNVRDPGLKTYRLFAGIGLTMPLVDGGLVRARVGEVAADRSALAARRADVALTIRREVEQALSDARVAFTVWQSDSSRVSAAREALRTAAAGYKGGTATGTDVRDAESALADARAEEAESLMDYWIARASLDRAAGVPPKGGD
jgi:outer membrane protein TolC